MSLNPTAPTAPASNPTASGLLLRAPQGFATNLSSGIDASQATIPLDAVAGLPTDTAVIIVVDPGVDGKQEMIIGFVESSNLVNCIRHVEGATTAHDDGAAVICKATAHQNNSLVNYLLEEHDEDGTHAPLLAQSSIISTAALIDACVTAAKLAVGSVVTSKLADLGVTVDKLAANAVVEAKVADGEITSRKMAPQIQQTTLSGSTTSEAVVGTITFTNPGADCKALIFVYNAASLGSGAPTQSWITRIREDGLTGTERASADSTKSAASGIGEADNAALFAVIDVPAGSPKTVVVTQQSTATVAAGGKLIGILFGT